MMKRLARLAVLSVVLTAFAVAAFGADEAKTPAAGTPAAATPAAKTPAVATPATKTPAVATPATGTPGAKPPATQNKVGVVKKVDVTAKQVVVMIARELTFTVTDSTKIVENDAPKKLEDIKVNDKVSVDYTNDGQQNRTATKIAIIKDTPAK